MLQNRVKIVKIFLMILFENFCTKNVIGNNKQSWWKFTFCFDHFGSLLANYGHFWFHLFFWSWSVWVVFKVILESCVPSVHSVHLIGVVSLTRAVSKISLSPFSETSGDLFDTFFWDSFIVSLRCTENVIKGDQVTSSSA